MEQHASVWSALKRAATRTFATMVVVVLGSCGGGGNFTEVAVASDASVFGEGYEHVFERYIEPMSVERIALDGMRGLHDIDESLEVRRTGDTVELYQNNKLVTQVGAPGPNDARGWAVATEAVVLAGREVSQPLREMDSEAVFEVVFDKALEPLDKYSRYSSAEEARENRALREGFGGIGVRIRIDDDGKTRVVSVMPETPADAAGLHADDAIVAVEGESIVGYDLRQVVRRLRGPRGSAVNVTVERENLKKPFDVSIVRQHINPDTVTMTAENGIVNLQITRFSHRTADDIETKIAEARSRFGDGLKGVILDLRDNPGGLLDQAISVSDLFLHSGRIVSTEGRHPGSFQRYDASSDDILDGDPMVVLINGRSASSSEIVAAALQDQGRAVLVGTNTFGKGTVQSVFRLDNGGELTLTWSRFHAPSGYTLQDLGVMPTVCTNGDDLDVDGLMAHVRSADLSTIPALHAWRSQAQPDEARRESLRAACPFEESETQEDRDLELEVAEALLGDDRLFQRALALVPAVNEPLTSAAAPTAIE